jgi:predicted dehydrogenase
MNSIPIAVIGAGLIGRTHIDRALKASGVELAAITDPSEEGRRVISAPSSTAARSPCARSTGCDRWRRLWR